MGEFLDQSSSENQNPSEVVETGNVYNMPDGTAIEVVAIKPGIGGNELVDLKITAPDGSVISDRKRLSVFQSELGALSSEQQGLPNEHEADADDESAAGTLTPEQQVAREKVLELLNHEQARILREKKPGTEAVTGHLIGIYEQMREAAQAGDFNKNIAGALVKDFIKSIYEETIQASNRYSDLALSGDQSAGEKLKELDERYDLAEEAVTALDALEQPAAEPVEAEDDDDGPERDEGDNDNEPPDNEDGQEQEDDGESPWLDPRYIETLKGRYEKELKEHLLATRGMDPDTLEHFKTVLKTRIIKIAVDDRIDRAEWLAGQGRLGDPGKHQRRPGFEPIAQWQIERPSKEIMQQMAGMMDMPEEELQQKVSRLEEKEAKARGEKDRAKIEFKVDQVVKHNGEEWKVLGIIDRGNFGKKITLVKEGGVATGVMEDDLREEQDAPLLDPNQEKTDLEKLKNYFGKPVVVKMPGGEFVLGRVGYSTTKHKALVAEQGGGWLPDPVEVKEFISWQNEVPNADRKFTIGQKVSVEKDGELQSGWEVVGFAKETTGTGDARTEHIVVLVKKDGADGRIEQGMLEKWRDMEFENKFGAYSTGQKIKVKNPDETGWLPGFTFVEYSPDEKTVIVAGPNGNKYQLIPKKFIDWQEEPGGEETIAVDQEEGDGVVMPEPEEGDPDAAEENPVEEKEEKEKDKEPRSWWRWTYDQWDKLPNNIAKNAAFAGFVLTAATVGSPMIVGFPVQHRIHYWRQRKKKEKADKEERERQEREESEASSRT
jgi:hypothetical protein